MTDNDWFSRYKFLQPIGQGGMGTVFLAEDRMQNNEPRVIKQLLDKSDTNDVEISEAVRLFTREAEILRQLNHHGIVKLYDYHVSPDGKYFLVMDFIPGRNLDTVVNTNGPLTSELVVRIGIHCCDVLEYLHEQSDPIIFRDLKPSNLMLTPDGRIIFIDFGIARHFMPKQIATRVVTAGYSPPEQYFGRPDTRSDIYSLGATLSHLLTGVRPRPLTSCNPSATNPTVMPSLNNLICMMTAHEVEDRPASAFNVRFALYHIYKEIHPEFVIPDEPVHGQTGPAAFITQGHLKTLAEEHNARRHQGVAWDAVRHSAGLPEIPPEVDGFTAIVDRLKRWFGAALKRS